ncbi:MAG: hypothetical protein K8F25_10535, partial [Fimbriimonadaceae bacterium]|nr:hypothetical protein [Alphaproteobacteria bacterium]
MTHDMFLLISPTFRAFHMTPDRFTDTQDWPDWLHEARAKDHMEPGSFWPAQIICDAVESSGEETPEEFKRAAAIGMFFLRPHGEGALAGPVEPGSWLVVQPGGYIIAVPPDAFAALFKPAPEDHAPGPDEGAAFIMPPGR